MTYFSLLAAASPALEWSPKVAFVMIICNVIAVAIAKSTVKYQSEGPKMPFSKLFGGFSLPMVIGAASFGHLLGAGAILGLASVGFL